MLADSSSIACILWLKACCAVAYAVRVDRMSVAAELNSMIRTRVMYWCQVMYVLCD